MALTSDSRITILGAGPAGITAALALANKGIPSVIIDKYRFPREKICGDGLSGKVVSSLDKIDPSIVSELEKSGIATGSKAVRFISPSGKMMELAFREDESDKPTGFICKRKDFDSFYLEKARRSSLITVKEGIEITIIRKENGTLVLEDENGSCISKSRLLLFAAGMEKSLLNQLQQEDISMIEGIGVRGYFENVKGSDHNHAIEIHFLQELLPWYLWIFPFEDGSANVGLALPENIARKSKQSLKELLLEVIRKYPHLKERFIDAKLPGKIEAKRLPYYNGKLPVAGDNYLLLGDAARLIDPFTGEGIGNAMVSGLLAAEIATECLEMKDFSRNATIAYQERLYSRLGPELDLGQKMQKLAKSRFLLNLVIGRASQSEKLRRQISAMLYSDKEKEKLKNPLFYFKIISRL